MTGAGGPRYRTAAIVLHWTIAALILVQVGLGLRMAASGAPRAFTPETFEIFQLHKSVGITILLLSLARLGARLAWPPPPPPPSLSLGERRLARAVHAGLYAVMIGMPLTGWLVVSASRLRLPTLLYGGAPWPDLPGFAALSDVAREPWRVAGAVGHKALAVGFLILFVLHVAGALKHQLSGDAAILARMAPGARPGRAAEPRLVAVLAGLLIAVGAGLLLQPRVPSARPAPAPMATAAAPVSDAPVQTDAPPLHWLVEPGSRLQFATAWGGQPIEGRFTRWRADIAFSPHALARSRVRVEIDLASVDTGDIQRDAVLRGADWLAVGARPVAVFTADRFEGLGGDRFRAHGRLALRGGERPLDLEFNLTTKGETARATGHGALDRTAFGVGQGEWARTDQIPAAVSIRMDLAARAEKSAASVGEAAPGASLGHNPAAPAPAAGGKTDERRHR